MAAIRMREVFVPGGLPRYTYVPREEHKLEERLRIANDNLCKLVTVTGPTKSGKSVLTQRVFPRSEVVWLDGGAFGSEGEVWSEVVSQLGGFTKLSASTETTNTAAIETSIEGKVGIPLIAGAQASATPSYSLERAKTSGLEREDDSKGVAIRLLRELKRPLIFDDFHYLDRDQQGNVIRALKGLIFDGSPVIVLAIPHRRYDAVRVEKEMTGRIEHIAIPIWEPAELREIADIGFDLLKMNVSPSIVEEFTTEALGSPHLMQEFCRHFCEACDVTEGLTQPTDVGLGVDLNELFRQVAEITSKTVFDRLARGPRPRTDRLLRKFVDGSTGDIYVAVLRAISHMKPGMTSIQYEDIRSSLRVILAETPPDMQQVSRVLDKMAEISATDQSSAPVLDWDKDERLLHITDPFFAFFLKWGLPG